MVQMLGGSGEIGARRHACDLAEVVAQMRLIVVAAFDGKIGPVRLLHAAQPRERVLEAPHAMKGLGRNAHLLVEELRHPTLLAGLTMERKALYALIDARVEEMLAAGVREEVRRADAAGASDTARKALGFEELLTGDIEAMKRRTRNYARRQLTWMRKLAAVNEIDVTDRSPADVATEIVALWLREAA